MRKQNYHAEIVLYEDESFMKKLKRVFSRLTYSHLFFFVLMILIGLGLIYISTKLPMFSDSAKKEENIWRLIVRDAGIALIPLAIIALIYEVFLRDDFLGNMYKTIKTLLPGRYTNIRNSGVIDVYENLRLDKLKDDFENLRNSEIRILDIWMENFNRIEDSLLMAVKEHDCKVRILLWNPQFTEAIESRVNALGNGYSTRGTVCDIMDNLAQMDNILRKLSGHEKADNFQIKLYSSFAAISYIGLGDECLVGLFLRGRFSSMGTQLKVAGRTAYFFHELDDHFGNQWNDANAVKFDRTTYIELQKWFDGYLCQGGREIKVD